MAEKILIVDDDEMVRIALVELLKPEGYDVLAVSSGMVALEKLEVETFDLMLLDIIMPEMDGIELCRRIRQLDRHKKTPIVFLTAKSQEADKVAGLEAGAGLFLSKPIPPDKLLEIISKAIG
jgi:DNA-binding response OmpR family regulator